MINNLPSIRQLSLLAFCLLLSTIATAQPGQRYSISDKKAIKLYEEAIRAYELRLSEEAAQLIEKAIERAPRFGEAYLLRAQVKMDEKDRKGAIDDLRQVTMIASRSFPQTYLFLGDLLMQEEDYADAKVQFETLLKMQLEAPPLNAEAMMKLESCRFAENAKANPVPFDPVNLGPSVNSEMAEYFPCITADSETFLFTRLVNDKRVRGGKQEDFFITMRDGDGWLPAEPLSEVNTPFNEGAPTLSADGSLLFFVACESFGGDWGSYDGLGSCDLFVSKRVGNTWGKAQNIRQVNSYDWDSQPSFSADGRTLYFVRGKHSGQGIKSQDIYYSQLKPDGTWTRPVLLPGKVNTPLAEESVLIHPDGETLYFSSNGHPGMGGLDIFYSKKQPDGSWGEPVNLGYPINTGGDENSLLVDAKGEVAYFASDRAGGYGDLDLYSFVLPENVRPNPVSYVRGVVYDAENRNKLEAIVELIDLETGQVAIESYSDARTGEFLVVLPPGRDYALNVSRPGYLFYSENFSLKGVEAGEPVNLEAPLDKLKEGKRMVLNNVFFDTDSYVLKPSSKVELNKLIALLEANPAMNIEIGGHTDAVGTDEDNQVLSQNRANSVVEYLVGQGISAERLTAKGYGESQPVATNETAEGRALNRRTEMKVMK